MSGFGLFGVLFWIVYVPFLLKRYWVRFNKFEKYLYSGMYIAHVIAVLFFFYGVLTN